MADKTVNTSRPPRRWLRWVGIIFGILVLLLVVGYFVGTSEWALKSVILPKVNTAMNANVTVDGASISPFSAVTLQGVKVETKGPEPLVTAKEVRLRYSLMDIIKGNINVSEATLESPVVNLITFADGTSNLDPITKGKEGDKSKNKETKDEKKSSEPPHVNVQKLALNNATVRILNQHKDPHKFPLELVELTGLNLTADDIANGKTGQLGLSANVRMNQGLNTASNGVIAATVGGKFNFTFDAALKPQVVKGQTKVDVTEAKGAFAQAAALGVTLNADLTPSQLNDVSVQLAQSGKILSTVSAKGPFSAETMEGKLAVNISQIDRQALNLVGAGMGIDFNQTTINSTNTVELTQRGRVIKVNGGLMLANFSATQKGQTTPPLDLRTAYAVDYDQTNKTALIQQFALNGTQKNTEFLRGTLAKPMLLDLGKGSNAVDESTFDLVITDFNLPDWQAFIGTNATVSSGKLGVNLNLVSQQAGKKLAITLSTQLKQLTAVAGSNRVENADLAFSTKGTVTDFSAVNLEQYRAELARAGQQALLASGVLQYNTKSQDADVQANLEVSLPQVATLVSMPGLNLQAGTVKFAGRIAQKNKTPQQTNNPVLDRAVVGKLNVDNLTGQFQSNRFDRFVTAVDLDVAMNGTAVEIKKCSGTLQQSGQAGGAFDVSGNLDTSKKVGLITAKLVDLNQHALKSFVAAALGDKQLESITINSANTVKLDGPADMSIKADLRVANLVVNDPSGAVPKTPLGIEAVADVAQVKGVWDLKTVRLALAKTERAPNTLNLAGRIDMTKSNAWTGNLNVTSEGMDVTPYYDLFAKKSDKAAAPKDSAPAQKIETAPKPEVEPEPMSLPFTQFAGDINIAKFFLREVAISNLVTKATIDHGRINLNPVSLTLNGGAVSLIALANVAVRGYEYDVNAKMDRVPVEPLVNTFAPEKNGQIKGDFLAGVQIKGAGVTGPNLKKNLQGNTILTLTNANVQVTQNKWIQSLLSPLALALSAPELAQSPLNWIDARTGIGSGTVTVTNATVRSSAFSAGIDGTMTLNDVLTNSTFNNMPVRIAIVGTLSSLTKRFVKSGDTNEYIVLPQFYAIGGTLGKPNPHIDKSALLKGAASEVISRVGGDTGNILRNLGGSLGLTPTNQASNATSTNKGQTNAPAASTNSLNNLLRGLGGALEKPASTNATTTTTNAPAQKKKGGFNLNDLLK